jgi:hypothetical protein
MSRGERDPKPTAHVLRVASPVEVIGDRRVKAVPDGVASAETNPLGDGTVLLLRLGKLLLRLESLVAL